MANAHSTIANLPAHAPEGYNPDAREIPTVYMVDLVEAIKAGVAATLLFSLAYAPVYYIYGNDALSLPRLFGSFLTGDPLIANLLGFAIHFGVGVGIALSYAVLLWIFRLQSNGGKGIVFGFLVFQAMFAFIIPWCTGWVARFGLPHVQLQPIDVMLNQAGHGNLGWEAPALVMLAYLLFGLVLGAMYRHKVRILDNKVRLEYGGG